MTDEDVWAAPAGGWTPVSGRLGTVRRVVLFSIVGVVGLALALPAGMFGSAPAAGGVVAFGVVVAALGSSFIGRQWRAIGYAEREDDLLVKKGVLFRTLVVVPYGRMQFVDVTAGPLDRRFGLARVQLHTASAATDASVPGLSAEEAARLRDRLAALGHVTSAGL